MGNDYENAGDTQKGAMNQIAGAFGPRRELAKKIQKQQPSAATDQSNDPYADIASGIRKRQGGDTSSNSGSSGSGY